MSEQPVPQVPQEPEQPLPQYIPPYVPPVDIPQAEQPAYQQAQYVPPTQTYSDPNLTSDDKTWGGLSYIPIVGLVVLFLQDKASRPFIKKQAVQSVALAAVVFLATLLVGWIPIIGWLFSFIVWLGFGVYMLFNLINALNGKDINIPVITDFVRKQGWIK
ncbi:MAG TPA: DUF4870 domain-containing protein [Anaerolineaceae bacterium]|nr:DUF4870 domain-containing protein [Anaerolineaceae bacterium]